MSVDKIIQAAQEVSTKANRSLHVYGDAQFKNTLTIGQIIKGKVLRHYEGSRYSVELSGQEMVVDSSIVLMEGSTIRGRVTAIDDKVILQRISEKELKHPSEDKEEIGRNQDLINLKQYLEAINMELSATQQNDLLKLLRGSVNRQLSLMASIILLKNGLGLSKNSLALAESALKGGKLQLPNALMDDAVRQIENDQIRSSITGNSIHIIADYLQKMLRAKWDANFIKTKTEKDAEKQAEDDAVYIQEDALFETDLIKPIMIQDHESFNANTWLMNAQVDGTISHRIATLPLWISGKIIEFDIAIFSQNKRKGVAVPQTQYQKIVLSLETVNLGKLNITVYVVNSHVRLCVESEDREKADLLSNYSCELYNKLNASSWVVDEIKYHERLDGNTLPVLEVAEHMIRQDSLSRLM